MIIKNLNPYKWIRHIIETYQNEIVYSINHTNIIDFELAESKIEEMLNFSVSVNDIDTTSAIFHYSQFGSVSALNFANYTNPGGGFIIGANAQEECLCAESTLYPVLMSFDETYYYHHYKQAEESRDRFIDYYPGGDDIMYHKDIVFERNNTVKSDIITAAAPIIYTGNIDSNYESILYNRIVKILRISNIERCDTLILGAFGCGAFGNDPVLVSRLFKIALEKVNICAKRVVFAIPKKGSNNYDEFNKTFNYI